MLDRYSSAIIKPVIELVARGLHRMGMRADHVTLLAFGVGVLAMLAIAMQAYLWGAVLILISRLGDGLDGALARLRQSTDAGGFLDITLDFLFYAGAPLAFAVANPAVNALPAAVLLAAFMGTGSSFLAFAALAAKRGLESAVYPTKSFYFLGGLTEATETIIVFVAMCVWPAYFPVLAYVFAGLCAITILTRIVGGYQRLKQPHNH
jgi:phosphatidylglycerophosphate synthase